MNYRDQSNGAESPGVAFCVDSTAGAVLAYQMGIKDSADTVAPQKNWSWGVKTCIENFDLGELRTLVI